MTKIHAKIRAIELRKEGHSYNHIAPIVGASKSTVSVWLADIPYMPNAETIARIGKALAASGAAKSALKRKSISDARREASILLETLSPRDLLLLGLGLYIGEGAKSIQQTCFVNSNPAIIRLMIKWFTKALKLKKNNLRLRLHVYPDCNEMESIAFWSGETKIPESQFMKTIVDKRNNKKRDRAGKLPHGTAHLTVNSMGEKQFGVFLARKIMAMSDIVLSEQELPRIAGMV